MVTIPAPNIAKTMPTNRIRSITGPSWSRMIVATGEPLVLTRGDVFDPRVRMIDEQQPQHRRRHDRGDDRAWDAAEGILGLLGQIRRLSRSRPAS